MAFPPRLATALINSCASFVRCNKDRASLVDHNWPYKQGFCYVREAFLAFACKWNNVPFSQNSSYPKNLKLVNIFKKITRWLVLLVPKIILPWKLVLKFIYVLCIDFFLLRFLYWFFWRKIIILIKIMSSENEFFQIELFSKSFNFVSNLTRYFTTLLEANPHGNNWTNLWRGIDAKNRVMLWQVECRIAESVSRSSSQT